MRILIVTQVVDPEDYVFGFFYGHIMDLAAVCDWVHVICLEHRGGTFPENVTVHSLGKESGATRGAALQTFISLIFSRNMHYDTVLVHMEPLYIVLAGLWWRVTGTRVVLWYNHVYYDWKLRAARYLAHAFVGVSKETMPIRHPHTRYVTYDQDLTDLLTKDRI